MKALIYARVSSKEQEETGYSLPSQEKLLLDYAQKHGFEVVKNFAISESASGQKQREVFTAMLGYASKHGVQVIICEKVDRLTRNLKDAVSVNEWIAQDPNRQIHFVKENCILSKESRSNEKFIWNIKVSVAQYYIDNLSEETRKGLKEKVAQGWLPHQPRIGYKSAELEGRKIQVIDEDKSPYIRKAFELFATGEYSLKRLSDSLYADGLRSNRNKRVHKSKISDILTDPIYLGKFRWKGEVYQGKHEPLITRELFDRAQSVLHGRGTPKFRKHFYTFKGLLRCTDCGYVVVWERHKGTLYGHCNYSYGRCTKKKWAKEQDLEKQAAERLSGLQVNSPRLAEWIHKALKESHKDQIEYHTTTQEELKKAYDRVQNRLDSLYDDKLDGRITEEFYDRKFKLYTEEKEQVLENMEKHSNASNKYYELGGTIFELSQKATQIFEKATVEQKRRLLNIVFNKIQLDGNAQALITEYALPFKILYGAVKETNSSTLAKTAQSEAQIIELAKNGSVNGKDAVLSASRSIWGARRESNPRDRLHRAAFYH